MLITKEGKAVAPCDNWHRELVWPLCFDSTNAWLFLLLNWITASWKISRKQICYTKLVNRNIAGNELFPIFIRKSYIYKLKFSAHILSLQTKMENKNTFFPLRCKKTHHVWVFSVNSEAVLDFVTFRKTLVSLVPMQLRAPFPKEHRKFSCPAFLYMQQTQKKAKCIWTLSWCLLSQTLLTHLCILLCFFETSMVSGEKYWLNWATIIHTFHRTYSKVIYSRRSLSLQEKKKVPDKAPGDVSSTQLAK